MPCLETPGAIHQSVLFFSLFFFFGIYLFIFSSCPCRYQLLLQKLVDYSEKGLDILSRRSSDDDVSANAAAAATNTDDLRISLQDEVGTLSRALRIMTVVPKMANDMMMVGRLQGFDVRISFDSFLRLVTNPKRLGRLIHLFCFYVFPPSCFLLFFVFFSPCLTSVFSTAAAVVPTTTRPNRAR